MKIEMGELEPKFFMDIGIGCMNLIIGFFADPILKHFQIMHNEANFPVIQVLWIMFWGFYVGWTMWYEMYYGKS